MELMNILSIFLIVTNISAEQTTPPPIWAKDVTFIIQPPATTVCQRKCMDFDNSYVSSVIVKSRNICKCIYICKTCSLAQCNDMCAENERLEGAPMDVCNFIDDICYSYKYVQEKN